MFTHRASSRSGERPSLDLSQNMQNRVDFQPFDRHADAAVGMTFQCKLLVIRNLDDFLRGNGRRDHDGQRADGRDFVIAADVCDIVLPGQVDEIHEQRAVVLSCDAQLREMAAFHANGRLVAKLAFEHGREKTADGSGAVFA